MKLNSITTVTLLVFVALLTSVANAQPTCETTFAPVGGNQGDWSEDDNWTAGEPNSSLVACIPAGKTAIIPNDGTPYVANAEAVWIKRDGSSRGKVQISNESTLKLYANSQVDGELRLIFDESHLTPQADLTITGNGGQIIGGDYANPPETGTAALVNGSYSLTLECDPGGDGSQSQCVVLKGCVDIQSALVNNAYVVADDGDTGPGVHTGNLRLSTNAKSGSGYWIASNNAAEGKIGRMVVDVAVSGAGQWLLTTHASAEIIVNAACTGLTGPVTIQKGKLTLNADFDTNGDLNLSWVSGNRPSINVDEGVVAAFGQ